MAGTRVKVHVLRVELAKRGWSGSDLARAANTTPATVSAAMRGRRISARTLRQIAEALQREPIVPAVEELLAD